MVFFSHCVQNSPSPMDKCKNQLYFCIKFFTIFFLRKGEREKMAYYLPSFELFLICGGRGNGI